MRLSESLVSKFQQAHLEEFGQVISAEMAEMELLELAELIDITSQTHHTAGHNNVNEDSNEQKRPTRNK